MEPHSTTSEAPAADFYDGASSRRRGVTLRFADALEIVEHGDTIAVWAYADIRRADSPRGLRLCCVTAPALARLDIANAATEDVLRRRCPTLDGADGQRHTARIVGWSLAASASLGVIVIFGIPLLADRLAPLVPFVIEKRIGEAVDKQVKFLFGERICQSAAGQDALNVLAGKLKAAGHVSRPLKVQVLASSLPNAFALPGGNVYVMDGLLQKAESADEVAGVIAHEMGHVEHRDSLRKVIQTSGTSYLIGLLFGDITGGSAVIFAGKSILSASYSRGAERAADDFAAATMRRLGRSPKPMGELLVRLTGKKGAATILDSHPMSAERLARLSEGQGPQGPALLDNEAWQALRGICKAEH